jgi:pimeloyl-ACP methyl ester carboxylesterase
MAASLNVRVDGVRLAYEVERFRVFAFDLRGHGDSDWPGEYSFRLALPAGPGHTRPPGLPA